VPAFAAAYARYLRPSKRAPPCPWRPLDAFLQQPATWRRPAVTRPARAWGLEPTAPGAARHVFTSGTRWIIGSRSAGSGITPGTIKRAQAATGAAVDGILRHPAIGLVELPSPFEMRKNGCVPKRGIAP
jgi:hypothetical protein